MRVFFPNRCFAIEMNIWYFIKPFDNLGQPCFTRLWSHGQMGHRPVVVRRHAEAR